MTESVWTFAFEIANFVVLAAVLVWLFFKPVRKALQNQQAQARQFQDEAAQKLADAERLRQQIETQHQDLAAELERMRADAQRAAKQEADQIIAEARAQMERERTTFKREALNIEQAQTARIGHAVAVATHDAVRQFLKQMQGPELEQTLIKAACRELQTFSNNSLAPVTVESAVSLDEKSQQLIKTSLGAAARSATFRIVPELLGGLRISTAHGLIDSSISGLSNFAKHSLTTVLQSLIREDSESE